VRKRRVARPFHTVDLELCASVRKRPGDPRPGRHRRDGLGGELDRQLASPFALPAPQEPALAFFVREAWPPAVTGTTLTAGRITAAEHLAITCELGEGGTVFGDGIEADRVTVAWGQRIESGAASRTLRLVG